MMYIVYLSLKFTRNQSQPFYTAFSQLYFKFISNIMFKVHISQPTSNSLHSHTENHHNCPFCQCQNSFNQTFSPTSRPYHQKNNQTFATAINQTLYTNPMIMTFAPHLNKFNNSTIFSSTYPVSPPKKNKSIIFNYLSPPKERKNNSAQARFNTKQFKNSRFPFIGNGQKNIGNKNDKNEGSKKYIMTNEMTPQKPKILKLNKMKSLERLKLSSQNGSNHASMQIRSQPENKQPIQRYQQQLNAKTPINILKQQMHQSYIPYSPNYAQHSPKHYQNTYIQPQKIKINQNKKQYVYNQNIDKKGQEIDIYNHNKYTQVQGNGIVDDKRRSYIEKEGYMQKLQQVQSDYYERQVAMSITDQLDLNYDYYYPIQDSDRSISVHIEL